MFSLSAPVHLMSPFSTQKSSHFVIHFKSVLHRKQAHLALSLGSVILNFKPDLARVFFNIFFNKSYQFFVYMPGFHVQ